MQSHQTPNGVKMFTGGPLETNFYLVRTPEGNLLIDAPEGAARALAGERISLLVLTHGHFDHVWDAAEIAQTQGCPVLMHQTTEEIMADRNLLRRIGIDLEVNPVKANRYLGEEHANLLGKDFQILEVPGHCPGSICLHDPGAGLFFGGDVLFAGGVGRWDLPGGDKDLLISGIRSKLLRLPDQTIVLPGHGPSTTIGVERVSNPYIA
jgi:hydroxyacylglutathione hydrolase